LLLIATFLELGDGGFGWLSLRWPFCWYLGVFCGWHARLVVSIWSVYYGGCDVRIELTAKIVVYVAHHGRDQLRHHHMLSDHRNWKLFTHTWKVVTHTWKLLQIRTVFLPLHD
jgi:hypothetical protein